MKKERKSGMGRGVRYLSRWLKDAGAGWLICAGWSVLSRRFPFIFLLLLRAEIADLKIRRAVFWRRKWAAFAGNCNSCFWVGILEPERRWKREEKSLAGGCTSALSCFGKATLIFFFFFFWRLWRLGRTPK